MCLCVIVFATCIYIYILICMCWIATGMEWVNAWRVNLFCHEPSWTSVLTSLWTKNTVVAACQCCRAQCLMDDPHGPVFNPGDVKSGANPIIGTEIFWAQKNQRSHDQATIQLPAPPLHRATCVHRVLNEVSGCRRRAQRREPSKKASCQASRWFFSKQQ